MAGNAFEVCKVTPPQSLPTDTSLPLTFFDLLWLRYPPADMLLFYEYPHPKTFTLHSLIPKLKNSLSLTLGHFLPLAGNILWPSSSPNPVIRYKEGDGVLFTVVVSDADFHHLTGKDIRECQMFSPLTAPIVGSDSQVPIFAFKVTIFPSKGFCICISSQHGVFDAKSLALFMKAWASIAKFGENEKGLGPELTPCFDRKALREQYAEIENSYIEILKLNGFAQNSLAVRNFEPSPGRVRGTFELSGLDVKKLKELVRDQVPYASTFTVTYAYVVLCIVRTKELTNDNRVFVGFPVDIRARLEPKQPANYFGNCVAFIDATLERQELLGKEGMKIIVNFISDGIKSLGNGVMKKIKHSVSNAFQERNPNDIEATRIYVVGSSKFGFQELDFGCGKPKKVDTTQVDKMSAITFTDLKEGGIEVELSLNKHEMKMFSLLFAQVLCEIIKPN